MTGNDDRLPVLDVVEQLEQMGLGLGGLDFAHDGGTFQLVDPTGQNIPLGSHRRNPILPRLGGIW